MKLKMKRGLVMSSSFVTRPSPSPSGHIYHPMNCANREMCYGCSNCEPEYWKEHFPQVYENFFSSLLTPFPPSHPSFRAVSSSLSDRIQLSPEKNAKL